MRAMAQPRRRWRRRYWLASALFVLSLAAYLGNGPIHASGDTIPNSLIPIALLTEGTLRLDNFSSAQEGWSSRLPYFLRRTPHGIVSLYPVATALIATPIMAPEIVLIASHTTPTPTRWLAAAHRMEKYTAAIITAASVVLFALLCWRLGFTDWLTVGLTLFYAFGSQAFCTSSQILWQHGPSTLAVIGTFLGFVTLRNRPSAMMASLFSLAWAMAVAIRPTNALLVGPLAALALYRFPSKSAYLLLPAAAVGMPIGAYNLYFFGRTLGGYAGEVILFAPEYMPTGLARSLLSPARGLFLYFPIALVAVLISARRPVLARDDLAKASLAAVGAFIILISSYLYWHAGNSVGPRYFTEVEPLLLVLFGLAWQTLHYRVRRPLAVLCFGVLLPYCVFVQSVGAYSTRPWAWNSERTERLLRADDFEKEGAAIVWDFRDNPIAHAFRR